MATPDDPDSSQVTASPGSPKPRGVPDWLVVSGIIAAVLIAACAALAPKLSSLARSRIQSILEDRFGSDVQIQNLKVSLFPLVQISGDSVVFRRKQDAGTPPLIQIARFTASGNLLELLVRRVSVVRLVGLEVHIPPKDPSRPQTSHKAGKPPYFAIDEMTADGAKVTTIPRDSGKTPLVFDIKKLQMRGGGTNSPMSFEAELTNAKPPGEIHSKGKFGPWDRDEPADTPVSGKYTLRDADLGVFKGIAGTLSSDGKYEGELGHIAVKGHTDVPNFMVTATGNPVHLVADYQAVVDGTNGDTYLQPVTAKFGHSTVVARGSVEGKPGIPGKTVSLDAVVNDGRLEDMLRLGVHANPPPLSGAISFHSKILIPPGDIDILQKLNLDGLFTVGTAKFSKLDVQEKVNDLSHRGKANPDDASAPSVASDFKGKFKLDQGIMQLQDLSFTVPGVEIALNGKYGLMNQSLNFQGTVQLDAKLSQTTTGWKSTLLKALDPFFKKKGSNTGSSIPITISGTTSNPSFGLDVLHRGDKPQKAASK